MTRTRFAPMLSAMITNSLEAAVAQRSADFEEPAVLVRGLRKAYGDVKAGDRIDLKVRRGEVLAVLGPNGAGKTTTVEILEGHRRADGGDVSVLGFDPARGEQIGRAHVCTPVT